MIRTRDTFLPDITYGTLVLDDGTLYQTGEPPRGPELIPDGDFLVKMTLSPRLGFVTP